MITEQRSVDPPKRRSGGVREYISPSRLNCWLGCPLKFKARYIDGIRTPTNPNLFLGKQVHSSLEHYYRHRMLGITLAPDDVTSQMEDAWGEAVMDEEMTFESVADETALKTKAAGLVTTYLTQVPEDEPRPLGVEVSMEAPLIDPFTGEDLGIPLLGITDLITAGNTIVDFKTAARSSPPFEVSHEIQLTSYSYLFRQLGGQQESGMEIHSIIKTKKPKIEVHAYPSRTEVHFRRLFAVISQWRCGLAAAANFQCLAVAMDASVLPSTGMRTARLHCHFHWCSIQLIE